MACLVPFCTGILSSTVMTHHLPARPSHRRTLYLPLSLYSQFKKQLRMAPGCSARLAIAATSQQSPIAPWHRSAGSIFPAKRRMR